MVVTTEVAAQVAAKSADAVFNLASSLVAEKPTRLSRLFFAFAPDAAVNWIVNRRLRLRQIKLHEDLFALCCKSLLDEYVKLSKKSARSAKDAKNPAVIGLLSQMEDDLRLLTTVKRSLAFLPAEESAGHHRNADDADISWWSMFEDFAKRPNEPWRVDLLARALAENDREPGSIRLKALWEIGMLEADDFGMLAFFCDSAVHLDGKPLVLLDPETQNEFVFDLDDGMRRGNLAYIVADLVDRRLVQKATTQFDTTESVTLTHLSGPHILRHTPPNFEEGNDSAIQITAFGPTDYALDICRLYEPRFNAASDANFEQFKRSLEEAPAESIGSVHFK